MKRVPGSQFSEERGLTENWELTTSSVSFVAGQESNQHAVEVLGRLFVGQVADAFEDQQTRIAKIPAQRLGRSKIDGAVSGSPDEESGIIANLGERRFQCREVRRPIPYDAQSMTQRVILECGQAVALERIGRDSRSVAKHPAQPQVVEGAPTLNRVAEEHGTERAAYKRRESLAVCRPGIEGRDEPQTPQARILSLATSFSTSRSHQDGDASAMRSAQQVEVFDAECVRELQDALGGRAYGAVHPLIRGGQSGAQIVDGIHGRVGRQRGQGESPGKGIAHQPMNQYQRRTRPGLEVAYASVGEVEPALFDPRVAINSGDAF